MIARDVITRALRLIKVIAANEPGEAEDLDVGLKALNGLLDSWSVEKNFVLSNTIESFAATGAISYTVGTGGNFATVAPIHIPIIEYTLNGVDYPLEEWDERVYSTIAVKTLVGQPSGYWYVPGAPLGRIYFAAAPASGSFKLHSMKPITEFTGLDTSYDLAPGYENALTFSLAVDLADEFETEAPKTVLLRAMNLKRALKRSNAVIPVLDAGVPIRPYYSGGWSA